MNSNAYLDSLPAVIEDKQRDKYGRTVRHFFPKTEMFRTKVVVVTLPKAYREKYVGQNYLVNDWQMPVWKDGVHVGDAPGKITYVATLKEARALAISKIEVAA